MPTMPAAALFRAYNELTNFSITTLESQLYPLDKEVRILFPNVNYIIVKSFGGFLLTLE